MQAGNPSPCSQASLCILQTRNIHLGFLQKTSSFYNYSYWNQFRSFIKYDPAPFPGLLGNRLWSWINRKILGRLPLSVLQPLDKHTFCIFTHNDGKKMLNRKCLTNVASQDIKRISLWLLQWIVRTFLIFFIVSSFYQMNFWNKISDTKIFLKVSNEWNIK